MLSLGAGTKASIVRLGRAMDASCGSREPPRPRPGARERNVSRNTLGGFSFLRYQMSRLLQYLLKCFVVRPPPPSLPTLPPLLWTKKCSSSSLKMTPILNINPREHPPLKLCCPHCAPSDMLTDGNSFSEILATRGQSCHAQHSHAFSDPHLRQSGRVVADARPSKSSEEVAQLPISIGQSCADI